MILSKHHIRLLITGSAALALFGCGESTISGTGIGGVDGVGPGGSPGASAEITEEQYEQYLTAADDRVLSQPHVIAPWADLLTAEQTAAAAVTPTSVTFPASEQMRAYEEGDILVSSNIDADKVFMRRIVGIQDTGGQITFTTENAAVNEVILQGDLSQAPTAMNPRTAEGNSMRTMTQQIGVTDAIPTNIRVEDGEVEVTGDLIDGSAGNFDYSLTATIQNPRFSVSDAGLDVDARISSSWWRTSSSRTTLQAGSVNGQPGTVSVRASCGAVTDALEFIKGSDADQQECKRVYDAWISSPEYPAIPSRILTENTYVTNVRRGGRGSSTYPRLACTNVRSAWIDGSVYMPYPEEVKWARNTCNGLLESFSLDAHFNPSAGVGKAGVTFEGEYGRELLPGEIIKERDKLVNLVPRSRQFFVAWIGWFPVVIRVDAKVIAGFYKFNAKGTVDFGIDNFSAGINSGISLRYSGAGLEERGAWSGGLNFDSNISGEPYFEGQLEGALTREFFGLEGGIYFYDLLGPYVVPGVLYGRLDAAGSTAAGADVCTFGITGGIKGEVGIRGSIPLTSIEKRWKLGEYDSCGSGDAPRTSKSFYEQETSFCVKHCIDSNPLEVSLEWDPVTDLDLAVIDPDGNRISYSAPNTAGAVHDNPSGCTQDRCEEGNNSENVTWGGTPAGGEYRLVVTNDSGTTSAPFTITVKAHKQDGTLYFEQEFSGTADADSSFEQEFSFNLDPQR